MMHSTAQLLGTPYVRGGRQVGIGLDCLGVVLEMARARGVDAQDPWHLLEQNWNCGVREPGTGFPPGWRQVADAPQDDDVVLLRTDLGGVGYVLDGYVWTASRHAGVHRLPLHRARMVVSQVWRRP